MCDEGRHGYHYVNSKERFTRPLARRGDKLEPLPRADALAAVRRELKEVARADGSTIAGVLSPFMTCEEAYLLCRFLKGLSGEVRLALGPIPVVGEDDTYPKDRHGRPLEPARFTIRAEKCPNRRGVEEVLKHYQGEVIAFEDVIVSAQEQRLRAVFLAAGYPPRSPGWITDAQATALGNVPLVVLQSLLPSPADAVATYILPAATFAEKDGTFVNHAGLAQAIHWAVSPPEEGRADGQVFLDLLERRGLVHAPTLRAELAKEVPFFAPLARGDLGEYGVRLGMK